jgi:hypothetical protein
VQRNVEVRVRWCVCVGGGLLKALAGFWKHVQSAVPDDKSASKEVLCVCGPVVLVT